MIEKILENNEATASVVTLLSQIVVWIITKYRYDMKRTVTKDNPSKFINYDSFFNKGKGIILQVFLYLLCTMICVFCLSLILNNDLGILLVPLIPLTFLLFILSCICIYSLYISIMKISIKSCPIYKDTYIIGQLKDGNAVRQTVKDVEEKNNRFLFYPKLNEIDEISFHKKHRNKKNNIIKKIRILILSFNYENQKLPNPENIKNSLDIIGIPIMSYTHEKQKVLDPENVKNSLSIIGIPIISFNYENQKVLDYENIKNSLNIIGIPIISYTYIKPKFNRN